MPEQDVPAPSSGALSAHYLEYGRKHFVNSELTEEVLNELNGDAVCFQRINEKYTSVEEDAPVEIGGQFPIPKRFTLEDLALAAECALYFARTGKLYPDVQWAERRRRR